MFRLGKAPTLVCHRGAHKIAPENTIPAAEKAFDLGADFVEIDVRVSADNVPFVIHDRTLDRTTNGTGLVADLAADDIDQLDAGSWFGPDFLGLPVPRLDDMYEVASGRGRLYVEIKTADPDMVVDMAARHGILGDCFFWSEDQATLNGLRASKKPVALMIRYQDYADPAAALERFAPVIMEFTAAEVSDGALNLCRRMGAEPMVCYGGYDRDVFRQLLAAGVALFNVDHPVVLLEVVAQT